MMQNVTPSEAHRVSAPKDIRWRTPKWKLILRSVAKKHSLEVEDILGRDRDADTCHARHEAFWRIRKKTRMSFPVMAQKLGGRNHTTICNSIQKFERIREKMRPLNAPAVTYRKIIIRTGFHPKLPKTGYSRKERVDYFHRRNAFILALRFELLWTTKKIARVVGISKHAVEHIVYAKKQQEKAQ